MRFRLPSALRRPMLTAVAAASAAAAIAAPGLAAPPEYPRVQMVVNQLTPYLEQKLERGEVVVLLKQRHPLYDLDVYGNVDGTPDQAWAAITAFASYKDFLPLVTDSAIRKRSGNKVWQYVQMAPPWPFHEQWMVNLNVEQKARGIVSWTQDDGNVRYEQGFWAVTAQPKGKSRVQYHLTVDPWMDTMPGWVVDMVTKTVMPQVINGVRKRVHQDQQARK